MATKMINKNPPKAAKPLLPMKVNLKNFVGRPRTFSSPQQMQDLAQEYFDFCDKAGDPYLMTGLCLSMGILPERLHEYENYPEYSMLVKSLRTRSQHSVIRGAIRHKLSAPMSIFWLKNVCGWVDKQEIVNKSLDSFTDSIKEYMINKQSAQVINIKPS